MTSAFVCFSFTFVFVQIPFVSRVEIMKTTKEREMPKKSNLHNKRTAKHERSVSRALDTSQWKKGYGRRRSGFLKQFGVSNQGVRGEFGKTGRLKWATVPHLFSCLSSLCSASRAQPEHPFFRFFRPLHLLSCQQMFVHECSQRPRILRRVRTRKDWLPRLKRCGS